MFVYHLHATLRANQHSLSVALFCRRSRHPQQCGQSAQEEAAHPGRHPVRGWRAEVDVDDDDGDDDGEGDETHGEEEVLADEGDDNGGGRDDLGEEEEEDGEGEEDGDAESDLLSAFARKVEDENSKEADGDAWNDEVHCVEQHLATHRHVERNVDALLVTTRLSLPVPA